MAWEEFRSLVAIVPWGPIISLIVVASGWYLKRRLDRVELMVRKYDLREKEARSDLALNVELSAKIIRHDGGLVLETQVNTQNISSRRWCIAAL